MILLDVNLPDGNGFDFAREMEKINAVLRRCYGIKNRKFMCMEIWRRLRKSSGKKERQNHYLRNWAANTNGKGNTYLADIDGQAQECSHRLIEGMKQAQGITTIYIPKKSENRKHWGDNTDTKQFLVSRNCQICSDYQNGMSIKQLAEKYYLSEKSIQRIIKQTNL